MITEKSILLCGHGSGNPSLKEMHTYLESRYNQYASNGKRKGVVEVRRRPSTTEADKAKFHDTYKTILGRNNYDQGKRTYVYKKYKDGGYYSDCSSSGCFTFKQFATCDDLNTAGIHNKWSKVPVEIKNGHITNPEVLQAGDAILFVGNDPSRPLQIGHVEFIYQINGTNEAFKSLAAEGTLTVTASALNIRSLPSTSGKVVGTYSKGATVKITEESGDWVKTSKGWISKKYLVGWIYEQDKWWYCENGSYPLYCIKEINGKDYAFDRDGWLITPDRFDDDFAITK